MKVLLALVLSCLVLSLNACAPETGSAAWCEDIGEKPKGDWTINEAKVYTRHCLFN